MKDDSPPHVEWPVCEDCGMEYPPDEPRSCDCHVGTAPLDEAWPDSEDE